MAARLCRARPPTIPVRSPVRKTTLPRQVTARFTSSKSILAYQIVNIPPWEVLHEHFTNRANTQPIIEDPYLDQRELIPSVLENFGNRKMLHGMIKVELTLMIWGYKDLDLPKEVCDLIIGNLSESISESSRPYEAPVKSPLEYLSPTIQEPQRSFKLDKPI